MADSTYISFYSKSGCIRIFKASVRAIGMPRFIRFRINEDATSLLLEPFDRITLTSFRVSAKLDDEEGKMEVYSKHSSKGYRNSSAGGTASHIVSPAKFCCGKVSCCTI